MSVTVEGTNFRVGCCITILTGAAVRSPRYLARGCRLCETLRSSLGNDNPFDRRSVGISPIISGATTGHGPQRNACHEGRSRHESDG